MDEQEALRFQAAVQIVGDAVIGIGTADLITSLNAAAERLLVCSAAAARGQRLRERCRFFQENNLHLVEIDPLALARENQSPFALAQILQIKVADHVPVPVEVIFRSIREPHGAPAGTVLVVRPVRSTYYDSLADKPSCMAGFVRDITEHKNSQDRLREVSRQRDEFLANLVHEIRSPMASVIGYSELLAMRMKDPADCAYLNIIKKSGDNIVMLVNDLLDLAKLEAGTLELVRAPVAIEPLLNEVLGLMHSREHEKGLRLSIHWDGPVPDSIDADPGRLRQVLLNLIGNIVELAGHGEVDLVARHNPARAILEIEIAATRIEETSKAQCRLLEPWVSLADTAALFKSGSGLGLTVTRRLVELMGGTIEWRYQDDMRHLLRISLPVADVEEREASPPDTNTRQYAAHVLAVDAVSPAKFKALNILLIDDNQVTCKSMGMLLEMAGHNVRIACNGREALAIAKAFFPSVVVSDIKLPDMDGFHLMRALRAISGMEKTKFIALSGYAESDFEGEEPKFHHFLHKPVKVEQLELLLAEPF